jgi:hypothetical protein
MGAYRANHRTIDRVRNATFCSAYVCRVGDPRKQPIASQRNVMSGKASVSFSGRASARVLYCFSMNDINKTRAKNNHTIRKSCEPGKIIDNGVMQCKISARQPQLPEPVNAIMQPNRVWRGRGEERRCDADIADGRAEVEKGQALGLTPGCSLAPPRRLPSLWRVECECKSSPCICCGTIAAIERPDLGN